MNIKLKKILVTGANGDIAMAIGRVLKLSMPSCEIYGADLGEKWPGNIVFSEMFVLPRADSIEYIASLVNLFEVEAFDLIIPATEPELQVLVEKIESIDHLPLLMNQPELLDIGLDKQLTNNWLGSLGITVPATYSLSDIDQSYLPVFVKPRTGSGSRGLSSVYKPQHLQLLQQAEDASEYVAQELLEPNEGEYTCAIFKALGESRVLVMRRWLVGGMTGKMVIASTPEIDSVLAKIVSGLPEVAAINVQLRMVNGTARIFEINPRLSSTVMMRHKIGFSDLMWWVNAWQGIAPESVSIQEGTWVYRTYDEIIVPPEV